MLGNIEWEDKKKQRCFVMWRTPDEWAALIFKWVKIQSSICKAFYFLEYFFDHCTVEKNCKGTVCVMLKIFYLGFKILVKNV